MHRNKDFKVIVCSNMSMFCLFLLLLGHAVNAVNAVHSCNARVGVIVETKNAGGVRCVRVQAAC